MACGLISIRLKLANYPVCFLFDRLLMMKSEI